MNLRCEELALFNPKKLFFLTGDVDFGYFGFRLNILQLELSLHFSLKIISCLNYSIE